MEKSKKIYMDYASSVTPNPSSIHAYGVEAKGKLEKARKEVAEILCTQKKNLIFTSGGTESNNLAIQGVVASYYENFYFSPPPRARGGAHGIKNFHNISQLPHIITTNVEHPSVLETCKMLENRKLAEITIVPVEVNGIVDPKKIRKQIKENTILVSVMYANNEIGTIQPIKEIAKEIRHHRKIRELNFSQVLGSPREHARPDHSKNLVPVFSFPFLHSDAVQAVNYLDINVERLGVDLMSLSGSKIEGAGKVGLLFKKKNIPLSNIFGGGDQEFGLRPGTENLGEILKFISAFKNLNKIKEKEGKRLSLLRDYFFKKLPNDFVINGDRVNRLPNNVNITYSKIPSDLLVIELSANGVMASSKSACKSSDSEGSYVIKAINPKISNEIGGLRFSLGKNTKKSDIDYAVLVLSKILIKLKKWY